MRESFNPHEIPKMLKRMEEREKRRKRRMLITIIILVLAAAIFLVWYSDIWIPAVEPEIESMVVPWNPGGMADLATQNLLSQAVPGMGVLNAPGANGADGLNRVTSAEHNGGTLAGTNLSSLVTLQLLGFTDAGYKDWAVWLTAYAPAIVAVHADSPYQSLEDLIAAAETTQLRCANAGEGTLGLVSANLFSSYAGISVEHISFSGSNPANDAVVNGEADFIVGLSTELLSKLVDVEFRALAAFSDDAIAFTGMDYAIPAVSETVPKLTRLVPFGEYYGIMIPSDTHKGVLKGYDKVWLDASASENFKTFAKEKGLQVLDVNRKNSGKITKKIAEIVCWTLYDSGAVNRSPDDLGIKRYSK